jgi:porphobilinogen synthase
VSYAFPSVRPRRLRHTKAIRRLVAETNLTPDHLVYPIFVHEEQDIEPIASMPGISRWPLAEVAQHARQAVEAGVPAIVLFGIPRIKDERATSAFAADGVIQQAIRRIKGAVPELLVFADTCLDEYTDHGHCGIVIDGRIDNDATLAVLARIAVSQAEAGADFVAPSDMMDGRVAAIRSALDSSGLSSTGIMAYSAKYASAFYGPFREAADCAPQFGDRRSYQMDPSNGREALKEAQLDLAEGADILMVKPALGYLDIVSALKAAFDVPIAAFNVSGEYSMLKAAAANGWIDERAAIVESVTSIRRAGASIVLTYHALELAGLLG